MPEINAVSYLAVAEDYATAANGISGLSQQYYDAAYEILILSVFDPELDLLAPFYNAYLSSTSIYNNVPLIAIDAVASLQGHVLTRATDATGSRYANVNDWLSDQGILVPEEFAGISALAGFTITSGNIS